MVPCQEKVDGRSLMTIDGWMGEKLLGSGRVPVGPGSSVTQNAEGDRLPAPHECPSAWRRSYLFGDFREQCWAEVR